MLRTKPLGGRCEIADPLKRDNPVDLSGLRRRIDLDLHSVLGLFNGDLNLLISSVKLEFSDKKIESLGVEDILTTHSLRFIHEKGSEDLRSIILNSVPVGNSIIVLHGYDERLLPQFSRLFDDLERADYAVQPKSSARRDITVQEKLESTNSFLLVVWTAEQKRAYLDKWPGSTGTREIRFAQSSIELR